MFRGLMKFSYRRTPLQAFGWYLTFLLICVVLAAPILFFGSDRTPLAGAFLAAAEAFVVSYHVVLGTMLLWNRPKNAINISLVVGGIVLSALAALAGLIALAMLTTRPSNISSEVTKVFE